MLIDSHTHLYLPEFDADGGGSAAVERALSAGIGRMMLPNVDMSTIAPMNNLHSLYPSKTDMAIGLHPTEVSVDWRKDINLIETEASTGKYKAIGEIGIDMYWDKTYRSEQMDAFRHQCQLAVNLDLPVIIHCREGLEEVLEVFKSLENVPSGVFHSFGGTRDDVDKIRRYGDFYFGINGIVTFKNCKLAEVLTHIGLDRILLETDSPYLAPVPKRGKRNESAYLNYISAFVANSFGKPEGDIERLTTDNYYKLFGNEI